ncbi:MAG: heparinase II/III family protein [Opitutaceae bacterium]
MKKSSVFFPPELVERARRNCERFPWAADIRDAVIARAEPWLGYSWDELWESVFGPGITRSWMVWSHGFCPACSNPVTMYNWEIDPFRHPWKVCCPHCREFFPKNDFQQFYRSGMDRAGWFRPELADRNLLVPSEEGSSGPPGFGIDDGEGYVDGGHRWRFIGAYLIYGQWKKLVLGGIQSLSEAWLVSGDVEYGRRAAILIDRVADVYPEFDFAEQGLVYEEKPRSGYVSNWHDACAETRQLVEAYDRIFPILEDDALIAYLKSRANRHGLANTKESAGEIRRNIEDRILRDALANRDKIYSNFPNEEQTCLVVETVLGWPDNREYILELIDAILVEGTAIDGVTGEKGLMAYGTIGPRGTAAILGQFGRLDHDFLREILLRHPRIRDHFRFHVDTWCLHSFYPKEGDGGGFNQNRADCFGTVFGFRGAPAPGLAPSPYAFLGQLYQLTGDPAFAQILHEGNERTTEGLPHDLFAEDPDAFQRMIRGVIAENGFLPTVGSVNKQQWHLAVLRSGDGDMARALWVDYDSMGRHCHFDAMNIGFFAHGLDLLPDFGYPPVQYGGWYSPKADWVKSSAAHNTVVVNGLNSKEGAGLTKLWVDRGPVQAIRVSGPDLTAAHRFERTIALIDVSAENAYAIDVFQVEGGNDHAWLLHGYAGEMRTAGLALQPGTDFGNGALMRDFRGDPGPAPGWQAEWTVDREMADLGDRPDVFLRFHGLTTGAAVDVAQSWVSLGYGKENRDAWIPQLLVRRRARDDLKSTFVGVFEPHTGHPEITGIRRLALEDDSGNDCGASSVALEIRLRDGRRDLMVLADSAGEGRSLHQPDWGLSLSGELCWIRRSRDGQISELTVAGGRATVKGRVFESKSAGFLTTSL